MPTLLQEIRLTFRHIRRRPGFAGMVIGILGLGLGAALATWTLLDHVLLRPLPVSNADQLVAIWETRPARESDRLNAAPANVQMWVEQASRFQGIAAFAPIEVDMTGVTDPRRIGAVRATHDFTGVLGIDPLIGRTFTADEHQVGTGLVALLDHELWLRVFRSDPEAVGRSIRLDGVEHVVVGVLPPQARMPLALRAGGTSAEAGVWIPLSLSDPAAGNPNGHWLTVIGRLREDVGLGEAQSEMTTIASRLERDRPDTNRDWSVRLEPLQQAIVGDTSTILWISWSAALLVLVIACTNVANLLLMRGIGRRGEMAVRSALGGRRSRLVRELLTESAVLSGLGCVLGLGLATGGLWILEAQGLHGFLPPGEALTVDGRILAFAIGLSLTAGVCTGLLSALKSSRTDLTGALHSTGARQGVDRRRHVLGGTLASLQIAVSLVLVVGAGLLVRSLWRLQEVDPGFDGSGVLAIDLTLPEWRYAQRATVEDFYASVISELEGMPGVRHVGLINRLPLEAESWCGTLMPLGLDIEPADVPCAEYRSVRGNYFEAMQISVLEGRPLGESDDGDAVGAMVVGRSMADRFWPGASPLGEQIVWGDTFTVVGVVEDVRHFGLATPAPLQFHVHHLQDPNTDEVRDMTIVVRAEGSPDALTSGVHARLRELDRGLPIADIRLMRAVQKDSTEIPRLRSTVFAVFGIVALLLALAGTYAVLAYIVSSRTREMGVRVALGAGPSDLVKGVLGTGSRIVVGGLVLGSSLALALSQTLSGFLYGVPPRDPGTFAVLVAFFIVVSVLAAVPPALRASRVDAAAMLRQDV